MVDKSEEESNIEMLPCSFKFHNFVVQVRDVAINCHIIKMEDCFYLWIGDSENAMNDLSFALESKYDKLPVATKIMGPVSDANSMNIAKRLVKRFKKPVYVSFNLQVDNLTLPGIERKIQEELKKCLDLLES